VSRLVLLIAVAAVFYLLLRRAQNLPPHKRRGEYIKIALGVAVFAVVILTLMGKMHWVGAAITGVLVALRQLAPTLIRLFPMLASLRNQAQAGGPGKGQQSTVQTDILRMQLDHDSGALTGEVLRGEYRGWYLQEMNREQLASLLQYCQTQDADSVQLLDSYLQQRFADQGGFEQSTQSAAPNAGGMSRKEALAVLGLDEQAGEEDIVAAHRKLMQKLHPDRGGNDFLAAQVNRAKEVLLG
jgi:hypothetical protein